jgi:hypothetical protein
LTGGAAEAYKSIIIHGSVTVLRESLPHEQA